jgi:hypothetical protein
MAILGIERSSASVLMRIRGHGFIAKGACRRKRGRAAVVAVEIHTKLSAFPPFVFVHFGRRRKVENTGRGGR